MNISALRPGDLGFTKIGGHAGTFVGAAQWLLAHTADSDDVFTFEHVYVVTEITDDGTVLAVEAMPGGAREVAINDRWTRDFAYLRPNYWSDDHKNQGVQVAAAARLYINVPYSFADYAAILGLHMGIDNGAVRRYVTASGHMICSQLADQALSDAGFHVFNDKRLPQDVMPIELYRALRAMPGTTVVQ